MPVSSRLIKSKEDLLQLEPAWKALVAGMDPGRTSMFSTWEWIHSWIGRFGNQIRQLAVIVCYEGEQVISICPLYIASARLHPKLPLNIKVLRFLGTGESEHEEVGTEFSDLIVSDALAASAARETARVILDELKGSWQLLRLDNILSGGAAGQYLVPLFEQRNNLHCERDACGQRFVIDLPESFDAYLKKLQGKFRYSVRHSMQKLRAMDSFGESWFTDVEDIEAGIRRLEKLHTERWSHAGKDGAFGSEAFENFHKDIARLFAEQDKLFLLLLTSDKGDLAAFYGFGHKDTFHFYQSGFDQSRSPGKDVSVGTAAVGMAIERAMERGYLKFDFMKGTPDSYKRRYECTLSPMEHVEICRAPSLPLIAKRLRAFIKSFGKKS